MYLEAFSGSTFFAIVAAALASIIISAFWYHPLLFGNAWLRLSGITPEMAERARRRRLLYAASGFAASMLAAFVLYWFGAFLNVYDWVSALQLSFWCWLGFTAPTLFSSALWQERPILAILIDVSYWLVALAAMACILLI